MLPGVVSVGFAPKNNSGALEKSSRGILEVKYGVRKVSKPLKTRFFGDFGAHFGYIGI